MGIGLYNKCVLTLSDCSSILDATQDVYLYITQLISQRINTMCTNESSHYTLYFIYNMMIAYVIS